MSLWSRLKARFSRAPGEMMFYPGAYDYKKQTLFEKMRVGLYGLEPFPRGDKQKLFKWSRESDLAFACIAMIVEGAQDPDLIVQRRKNEKSPWENEAGHPLRQLIMRPNPGQEGYEPMTEAEFLGAWLSSEEVCGEFFAEIERDKRGRPIALWPLDPTSIEPAWIAYPTGNMKGWIWRGYGEEVHLKPEDVFYSCRRDPQCPWMPIAPLRVALGSIEADFMQTAFVRSFFKNSGVPSGIINIKGRSLTDDQAESIRQRWIKRYGHSGRYQAGPAVFDENGEYQKIGSDLHEIEGASLRAQVEARICGVFGVPPLLVSAYVGLLYVNQRASAKEAQADFWANKMSPTFKRMRTRLTWTLLLEFEDESDVREERVRLNWNMDQVIALQESMSERSMRAREDFRVGGLTLNEFRATLGMAPIPDGDYYLRRANQIPITMDVIRQQIQAAASVTSQALSLQLTGARDPAAAASDLSDLSDLETRTRKRRLRRKANDDDDFLDEEITGDTSAVEENKTYWMWTQYLNSENPCWFCAELDGKQEITEKGVKPNSIAGPNPLCLSAEFGPNLCHCQCDPEEITAEEARQYGGVGAVGRFTSERQLSAAEIEKLKNKYRGQVGEGEAGFKTVNWHWHKAPDGKWYAWAKVGDTWYRLDEPPPGHKFIPPQDEKPGLGFEPDPSWPVAPGAPIGGTEAPGPTVWSQDPGGNPGQYTYVPEIGGWVKSTSLNEWQLRPDGTWVRKNP